MKSMESIVSATDFWKAIRERVIEWSAFVLSHEEFLHVACVMVGIPLLILLACLVNKNAKKYFINKFRMAALKKKDFFGTYAQNIKELKIFYAQCPIYIIPVHLEDARLKIVLSPPEGVAMDIMKEVLKQQARAQTRELRKEHKSTLYYVRDWWWNKSVLGFKHGKLTQQLAR